jgi:hypothetical protein
VRTLKVKCPTWQHVETFYERKLRPDKTLTIRVPFNPQEGSNVTLGLQLPDGSVTAIEGKVLGVMASPSGKKAAIRLHLHGMTEEVLGRLRAQVEASRKDSPTAHDRMMASAGAERMVPGRSDPALRRNSQTAVPTMPPAPLPEDAPIDEVVDMPSAPVADQVSEFERDVFMQLEAELKQLKECAAHEVLGVTPDAEVVHIRHAYFARTKHFHPDLFARYRSPVIMYMAQEVFIYINRAYDRMRDAAVAAGRAVLAGPALLPHDGWLAGLDDISAAEPVAGAGREAGEGRARPLGQVQGTAEELMAAGDYEGAREHVADALHADPRNRQLRALYYVVGGKQALSAGDTVLASSQFEAALAHDHDCAEARAALDELRARGQHSGVFSRTLR